MSLYTPVLASLFMYGGASSPSEKLTPSFVVAAIDRIARAGVPLAMDTRAVNLRRENLAKVLIRINKCSEETVKRVCELLEVPDKDRDKTPIFDRSVICQIWFLLRYKPLN